MSFHIIFPFLLLVVPLGLKQINFKPWNLESVLIQNEGERRQERAQSCGFPKLLSVQDSQPQCASSHLPLWSSYDRIWFSGPDKQEIVILILILSIFHSDLTRFTQRSTNDRPLFSDPCKPEMLFILILSIFHSDLTRFTHRSSNDRPLFSDSCKPEMLFILSIFHSDLTRFTQRSSNDRPLFSDPCKPEMLFILINRVASE
jgi:hypothetical protein